jgi:hypothetical protein
VDIIKQPSDVHPYPPQDESFEKTFISLAPGP